MGVCQSWIVASICNLIGFIMIGVAVCIKMPSLLLIASVLYGSGNGIVRSCSCAWLSQKFKDPTMAFSWQWLGGNLAGSVGYPLIAYMVSVLSVQTLLFIISGFFCLTFFVSSKYNSGVYTICVILPYKHTRDWQSFIGCRDDSISNW